MVFQLVLVLQWIFKWFVERLVQCAFELGSVLVTAVLLAAILLAAVIFTAVIERGGTEQQCG